MTQLVLSLFPGIGLLDMGFEAERFVVEMPLGTRVYES